MGIQRGLPINVEQFITFIIIPYVKSSSNLNPIAFLDLLLTPFATDGTLQRLDARPFSRFVSTLTLEIQTVKHSPSTHERKYERL